MLIFFSETNAKEIVGVDVSNGMLNIARSKINNLGIGSRIKVEYQNAENLNFQSDLFDVVSVTYGLRNFSNLELGLRQTYRVIKKGGLFVVLETSIPNNKYIRFFYKLYTRNIIPLLANFFSNDAEAYKYLVSSATQFPHGVRFKKLLEEIGFRNIIISPQFFGSSTIYYCTK